MIRFLGVILLLTFIHSTFAQSQIQYIANEGILISIDENNILIDAIFDDYYKQFSAPSEKTINNLNSKKTPFENIDLLLITHAHLDHFNASMIGDFVIAHDETRIICTNQALDSLVLNKEVFNQIEPRVKGVNSSKEWQTHSTKNIQVKTTFVRHGGEQNYNVDNHVYLIECEGKTLLHIGDAEMDINHFNHLDLENSNIDVALVPFWFLAFPPGVEILNSKIKPKKIIGIHYPKVGDPKTLQMIKSNFPDATVFQTEGEKIEF